MFSRSIVIPITSPSSLKHPKSQLDQIDCRRNLSSDKSPMSDQGDEWITVGHSGRPKSSNSRSGKAKASHRHTSNDRTKPPTQKEIDRVTEAIETARRETSASQFFTHLVPILTLSGALNCQQLIVYGLGSLDQPGAVHIRYQIALSILLHSLLPSTAAPPFTYDPVYTLLDTTILPLLNLHILEHNEQGRHIAHQPTLFFMPHCEADLTDNLLAANIEAGTLHHVYILGNSFAQYKERWSIPSLAPKGRPRPDVLLDTILRDSPLKEGGSIVKEYRVSECLFPVASAFNDLSLHVFSADWKDMI